jgi:hypothetical protein
MTTKQYIEQLSTDELIDVYTALVELGTTGTIYKIVGEEIDNRCFEAQVFVFQSAANG